MVEGLLGTHGTKFKVLTQNLNKNKKLKQMIKKKSKNVKALFQSWWFQSRNLYVNLINDENVVNLL